MNAFDQLMADALSIASAHLDRYAEASSFREEYLEQAFIEGVVQARPNASARSTGHGRVSIPNWDRELGGFDLRIRLGEDYESEALVEAKVDDVDQTLWDLFKLAAGLSMPGVEAGYLLVARHRHRWDDGDCTSLFAESSRPIRWDSAAMFEDWKAAWAALLKGGAARPTSVPSEIETAFVGRAPAMGFDPYEVRCVAVRLIPNAGALRFENDWPTPGKLA
jgi:hypothetical protein